MLAERLWSNNLLQNSIKKKKIGKQLFSLFDFIDVLKNL
jgi:hypothetical protein